MTLQARNKTIKTGTPITRQVSAQKRVSMAIEILTVKDVPIRMHNLKSARFSYQST